MDGLIEEGKKQIELGQITLDMNIKSLELNNVTNIAKVKVKRNSGFGNLAAIRFIFYTEVASEQFRRETNIQELEERTFEFELVLLDVDDLTEVSLAPIILTTDNEEILGSIIDTYQVTSSSSSSSGSSGGPPPPCIPNCNGKQCGDDGCLPYNTSACGTCNASTTCNIQGQCIIVTCSLDDAYWNETSVMNGSKVKLSVDGTDCDNESISFEILEYDAGSADDPVNTNPSNSNFVSNTAEATWISEWQDDGGLDPTYYFIATIVNTTLSINSSDPKLNVTLIPNCIDNDSDGYNISGVGCGTVDCNDSNPNINPGESEICNGIDDNCVSGIDESEGDCSGAIPYCFSGTCVECEIPSHCDDNLYCNGDETCAGNSCQSGIAIDCNDSVGCTIDSCNEGTDSCNNLPNNSVCDDGAYCNGTETCHITLGCQAGTPIVCNDSDVCTNDNCNEILDNCSFVNICIVCDLINAYWNETSVNNGTEVKLTVNGTDCNSQEVNFSVWEDDGVGPADPVNINPGNVFFIGNDTSSTWLAEWQNDSDGDGDPAEYYFIATLVSNASENIQSNNPKLDVYQLILNTAPTHNSPIILPYPTYNNNNMTCFNQSTTDADGERVTNIYNWKVNGTPLTVLNMPFDTNNDSFVKDYSGNGNNGILNGNPNWTTECKIGGCYEFNDDDHIEISSSSAKEVFDPGNNFSIAFWFYPTKLATSAEFMFSKAYTSHDPPYYQISIRRDTNNQTQATVHRNDITGDYLQALSSVGNVPLNTWYHAVMTMDASNDELYLYIDGVQEGSDTTPSGTYVNWDSNLSIGENFNFASTSYDFHGRIDDFRIYNRSLSAEQVNRIYLDTKDGLSSSSIIVSNETNSFENWTCEVTPSDGIGDGITKVNSSLINELPCILTNATWSHQNISNGSLVTLTVDGTNCDGLELNFTVTESESGEPLGGGDDPANINPVNANFSGNTATTTWVAEWQNDCGGFCNPPEYFFIATLVNNASENIDSTDYWHLLEVERISYPIIIKIFSPINQTVYDVDYFDLNWSVEGYIDWCGYSLDGQKNDSSIYTPGFEILGYEFDSIKMDVTKAVNIQGDYAYIVSDINDSLTIINITNKSDPMIVSSFSNTSSIERPWDLDVVGNYAFVISREWPEYLTVIDVSDKTNPVQVASAINISAVYWASSLHIEGDYAYITSIGNDGIVIVDISNPLNPVWVGGFENVTSTSNLLSIFIHE